MRRSLPSMTDAQKEDAKRLVAHTRHLLCNPIGSGKTRVSLAAGQFLLDTGRVGRLIVLANRQLKTEAWLDEIENHFPDLQATVIDGTRKERPGILSSFEKGVTPVALIHYEQLIMPDVNEWLWRLVRKHDPAFIVDEAHNLKDRGGVQAKAFTKLAKETKHTYLVTGTPLMNNPTDLFNLFHILDPKILGTWRGFLKRYCSVRRIPIHLPRKFPVKGGPEFKKIFLEQADGFLPGAREELQPIVSAYMIKRELDTSFLPGLTVVHRSVGMTPEQRRVYRRADKEEVLDIKGDLFPIESALVKLTRLRQIASGTFLDNPGGKELELLSVLQETLGAGRKTIVYSPYRTTILRLRALLQTSLGVSPAVLVGGMTLEEQGEVLSSFRGDTDVLLMNDVGSEGLRLEAASAVIIYDLNWNPARLDQIIGRAWRRGQTKPVYVAYLLMEDSVDHRLMYLIEHKRDLMEQVDSMSKETLREVVKHVLR